MPSFQPVMQWVTKLPEVGEPILKEREAVIALTRDAAEFDRLASEKRGEAYLASLALEGRIRGEKWMDAEIDAAKAKTND